MDRRLLPRALLAALAFLSVVAVLTSLHGNGHRPRAFGAPSYGFAGYTQPATVSQISARWRVPFFAPNAYFGAASTWVAAESSDGHFIQLGTTENVTGRTQSFNVFWSDPVVHFEPQSIGVVAAGNMISYSMTKTSSGWVLRFRDRTTSQSRRVSVRYGQTTSFNEGQWIQEDPTFSNFSEHLPYPPMSLVTFSHLKLNGRIPTLRFTYAQAMSTSNGVFLIPSKVRHNSFTFHHAKGDALQYLRDALPFNTAMYPFSQDVQDNVAPTAFTVQDVKNNIGQFIGNLASQHWPKGTRTDIAGIIANVRQLRTLVAHWPVAPASVGAELYGEFQDSRAAGDPYILDLHARLGIPPRD